MRQLAALAQAVNRSVADAEVPRDLGYPEQAFFGSAGPVAVLGTKSGTKILRFFCERLGRTGERRPGAFSG